MCLETILGLAGSIFNGINQKNASKKAAGAQTDAALQALALQQGGLDKALGYQKTGLDRSLKLQQKGIIAGKNYLNTSLQFTKNQLAQGRKDIGAGIQGFAPWYDAGKSALMQLQRENGLAPGGSNFTATPGYQFRYNEGLRGVQSSLAALGMKNSGAALKGIDRYGQGIASEEYGNYYNRLAGMADNGQNAATNMANLRTNMANLSAGAADRVGNTYTGLANTVTGGYNNMSGLVSNTANNNANLVTNAATNMGNTLQDAGAYRASGYVGQSNALTGMVNSGVNQLGNYLGYSKFPTAPSGGLY